MAENKNIHKNHRQRMFARYDKTGLAGFDEHEVLEMLLFYVIKCKNTNDTAHLLLNRFKCLSEVLNAPAEKLVKIPGVAAETARYLNLWGEAFKRQDYVKTPKTFRGDVARKFLTQLFRGKNREEMYIICLDPQDNILSYDMLTSGSFESTGVDIGKAIKIALDYDSAQVVFAHNHPSGIMLASEADLAATRSLMYALNLVNVKMRDHIIVANDECLSIMTQYDVTPDKSIRRKKKINP